jgi:tetratricopeptide (TPR) repeat protein
VAFLAHPVRAVSPPPNPGDWLADVAPAELGAIASQLRQRIPRLLVGSEDPELANLIDEPASEDAYKADARSHQAPSLEESPVGPIQKRQERELVHRLIEASVAEQREKPLALARAAVADLVPITPPKSLARMRLLVLAALIEIASERMDTAHIFLVNAQSLDTQAMLGPVLRQLMAISASELSEPVRLDLLQSLQRNGERPSFPGPDFPPGPHWDTLRAARFFALALHYGSAYDFRHSHVLEARITRITAARFAMDAGINASTDALWSDTKSLVEPSLLRLQADQALSWLRAFLDTQKQKSSPLPFELAEKLNGYIVRAYLEKRDFQSASEYLQAMLRMDDTAVLPDGETRANAKLRAVSVLADAAPPGVALRFVEALYREFSAGTVPRAAEIRFQLGLRLLTLYGKNYDLTSATSILSTLQALASTLDADSTSLFSLKLHESGLNLAKAAGLAQFPERRVDAIAMYEAALAPLNTVVPLRTCNLDNVSVLAPYGGSLDDDGVHRPSATELQLQGFQQLGRLYLSQGNYAKAQDLLIRSLFISYATKTVAGDIPEQSGLQLELVHAYIGMNKAGRRDSFLQEALLQRSLSNPEGAPLSAALVPTAEVLARKHDFYGAIATLNRAISYLNSLGDPDPALLADALSQLSVLELKIGARVEAMPSAHLAVKEILALSRSDASVFNTAVRLISQLYALLTLAGLPETPKTEITRDAFALAQWMTSLSASISIEALAKRLTIENPDAASAFQRQVGLLQRKARLEADLRLRVFARGGPEIAEALKVLTAEIGDVEKKLHAEEVSLEKSYPRFADITRFSPVEPSELQRSLRRDEALLILVDARDSGFAVIATAHHILVQKLKISPDATRDLTQRLRKSLNFQRVASSAEKRTPFPRFDVQSAKTLYRGLLTPLEGSIQPSTELMVVSGGVYSTVPLNILVKEGSLTGPAEEPRSYERLTFSSDIYAFGWAPSTSSILALRSKVAQSIGGRSLLVLADPRLEGPRQDDAPHLPMLLGLDPRAKISELRKLPRLDQTVGIAEALQSALGGLDEDKWLGTEASKSHLLAFDRQGLLARYRVIAFATHGLVAGDLPAIGLDEPALVLTPPLTTSSNATNDDGLLRASEAAELHLNANWILLLACSTASGESLQGAEPLSGLARSFILAGGRALVVTQWPSEAGATRAFSQHLFGAGDIGYKSVTSAVRAMRKSAPELSHPALWGSFVYVGG